MRFARNAGALILIVPLALTACDDEATGPDRNVKHTDQLIAMLAASGEWEVAANPVTLTTELAEDFSAHAADVALTPAALAAAAERDRTWYAADGTRYEALYIHVDGRTYGRRSAPAPARALPHAGNGFGAFAGTDAGEGPARIEGETLGADDPSAADPDPLSPEARIWTNWTIDRRYRVSTGMTTYPTRTIGSLSGSGGTQDGACTGTKVGPRAVLTAAHCVMGSSGNITFSGRFNPGQTSTTRPNGSIPWSGLFLRDWRIHRKYDYAILFLKDSPATVGLGWMGIGWWNSASGYNGRWASLFGYPCGANRGCGQITQQRCKASPRADKRCDGWMYGHSRPLTLISYMSNDLLQYDNDMSSGQSGSAVYTWYNGEPMILAVNTHSTNDISRGVRFRQSMWNDVCSWIAVGQSAYGTHALCH